MRGESGYGLARLRRGERLRRSARSFVTAGPLPTDSQRETGFRDKNARTAADATMVAPALFGERQRAGPSAAGDSLHLDRRSWIRSCRSRGGAALAPMFSFRTTADEIMDHEGLTPRGLRILADLDRWNRTIRWYDGHVRRIAVHWEALGRPSPFRILDVGTGPGGLLDALASSGLPVELTGVDHNPAYVEYARTRLGARARMLEGDATRLDVDGFDLVTNTLMMHHLPQEVRVAMVREMGRVARSVYLFDLEVTVHGAVGFAVLGRLLGLGADCVSDGVTSVRRASTFVEFGELVAGLPVRAIRVFPSAMCTMPSAPPA